MMHCSNTAALRAYEAEQDRLEAQAPSPEELERYVDDWLERKARKMGSKFLSEAFCEAFDYQRIYTAWLEGDTVEVGHAFDKLIREYWTPQAIEASDSHNFAEDRRGDY